MKNFFLTFFLFTLVFSLFIFILLYYSFNLSSDNNFLNKKFRAGFSSNLLLRNLFKLHRIGDARSDYLSTKNFSQLEITIYSPFRNSFSEDFKNTLIDRIGQITNKPAGIFIKEESLDLLVRRSLGEGGSTLSDLSDLDLANIIKTHPVSLSVRRSFSEGGKNSAQLQIFLLESYAGAPTNIGLVKDAYHIFLFSKPLEDISHFEKTSDNAYLSTILHEFVHLLGAGHVVNDRCILSEKVEDIAFGRPAEITTTFCPEDLEEIKKASAN